MQSKEEVKARLARYRGKNRDHINMNRRKSLTVKYLMFSIRYALV